MGKSIFTEAIAVVKNNAGIEIDRKVVDPVEANSLRNSHTDCTVEFMCAGIHDGISCDALLSLKESPKGTFFFSSRHVEDHIDNCPFGAKAKAKKRSSVATLNTCSLDYIPDFRIQGENRSGSTPIQSAARSEGNVDGRENERIHEFEEVPVEYTPSKKLKDNAAFYDSCGVNAVIDRNTGRRVKDVFYNAKTRQYYKNGELEFIPGKKMIVNAGKTRDYSLLDTFIVGKGYRNTLVLTDDSTDNSKAYFVVLFPNSKKLDKAKNLVFPSKEDTRFLFAGDILAVDKEALPGHTVVAIGVAVLRNFIKKK